MMSVSLFIMITAIKTTTRQSMTNVHNYMCSLLQAKKHLIDLINRFIRERIILAGEAISKTYAKSKIHDGDVILTYAW